MKRTNLVLDEKLLESAVSIFGSKTYSDAVNYALREAIKLAKVRQLPSFFGTGIWEGELSEMREDISRIPKKQIRSKRNTNTK